MSSAASVSYFAPVSTFFVCFRVLHFFVKTKLPFPSSLSPHKQWSYRNTVISLINSCISSAWSVSCFIEKPTMFIHLFGDWDKLSYYSLAYLVGYLLHDSVDNILSGFRSTDILIHHKMVLLCIGTALYTKKYIPFVMCLTLMEINSIFLHIRRMLRFFGVNKTNRFYRINMTALFVSFVALRFLFLAWLICWFVVKGNGIWLLHFSFGLIGFCSLFVTNTILFLRIWKTEYDIKIKQK